MSTPSPARIAEDSRIWARGHRLEAIDLMRGLVVAIMAIDHVRDFFSNADFDPLDFSRTTPALFLTRWITHFCAPLFSLLTGVGAYLWFSRGRTPAQLTRFLLTRGAWLVILELTLVHLGWTFDLRFTVVLGGVIWILGWSMIVLALACRLPMWANTLLAILIVAGHNMLDGISAASFGSLAWLWTLLHSPMPIRVSSAHSFDVAYVLIPWCGVMMAGFSLGAVYNWEPERRRRFLLLLGACLIALFAFLRGVNTYGDPAPWAAQKTSLFTFFSYINCVKYPPSLDYLLMTLGPSLLLLGLLDGVTLSSLRPLVTFGRVPIFFYLLPLPLMHLMAIAVGLVQYGDAHWFFSRPTPDTFPTLKPPGWGFGLPGVYLAWFLLLLMLYPLCRWFAGLKQRRKDAWLSYL